MDYQSAGMLGSGLVAISGGALVVTGLFNGDNNSVIIGSSAISIAGGSIAALSASETGR
ncbi:hypothetical protein ACFQJ7_00015 [Halovenus rubra]|uniref:Uncharacterized protein n=2 Tax=Halovenus rubra TaxID=869890 RepID=A0ACC7E103_9EURY|nr:hypothetical protein [Halovenus rubra]